MDFKFAPIQSKVAQDKHIMYESNEELLRDIQKQLEEEAAENKASGKRAANYYIDKKEFASELVKSKLQGKLTDAAVVMFQKLIFHVQRRLFYKDPEVKAECASEALHMCLENWHRYDVQKTQNAFAFFTTTVLNGLVRGWHKANMPGTHLPIELLYQTDRKVD